MRALIHSLGYWRITRSQLLQADTFTCDRRTGHVILSISPWEKTTVFVSLLPSFSCCWAIGGGGSLHIYGGQDPDGTRYTSHQLIESLTATCQCSDQQLSSLHPTLNPVPMKVNETWLQAQATMREVRPSLLPDLSRHLPS